MSQSGNARHETAGRDDLESKQVWRTRVLAARRSLSDDVRAAEAEALTRALLAVTGEVVCAFVPVGHEPGSPELPDVLRAAGRRVLLPVVTGSGLLDWAEHTGRDTLRQGRYRVLEPTGPRLGPATLSTVDVVLLPALAVDRLGTRLGRGGGHYDRSLRLVAPGTPVLAVVRDAELVDRLPVEPHDMPVSGVITPGRSLVMLSS